MGYTTHFEGKFTITPPLTAEHAREYAALQELDRREMPTGVPDAYLQWEVRGDDAVQKIDARVKPAAADDWDTEYLDSIIAARVVDGVTEAIAQSTYPSQPIRLIVSFAAGGLSVAMAIRRVVRLAPAEAMRPPAPAVYHRTLLERLRLSTIAGPTAMMVLREIELGRLRVDQWLSYGQADMVPLEHPVAECVTVAKQVDEVTGLSTLVVIDRPPPKASTATRCEVDGRCKALSRPHATCMPGGVPGKAFTMDLSPISEAESGWLSLEPSR